jgi:hypothetical protein
MQQSRSMFLKYFWSIIKVDMSKMLLGNKKNPKEAQKISVKIFSISDETRDQYIDAYMKYCRDIHVIKYIEWRQKNRRF